MGAGKVLYHWRVFPIHLSEPPTLPLIWTTKGNTTASPMLASTGQHNEVADRWQDAVQQHLGSGGAVLAGRLQPEMRAARECRAWPLAGVPSEGPVIFRCACQSLTFTSQEWHERSLPCSAESAQIRPTCHEETPADSCQRCPRRKEYQVQQPY